MANVNESMRRILVLLATIGLVSLTGAAQAAETGPVREVYACNFKEGSDMDDLMSARDFYLKQMEKAGITADPAFVWTPIAGTPDWDFIWFNNLSNLNAFGQGFDKYEASPEGQAAAARFNSVARCDMSLATHQQFFDGGEFGATERAVISSSACRLRHGQTMQNMQDLITHLKGVLADSDLHKSFLAYMNVPMVSTTDADLFLYGVHENMADYAARTTEISTADSWGMLRRHFAQVLDCKASLWWGEPVVPAQ